MRLEQAEREWHVNLIRILDKIDKNKALSKDDLDTVREVCADRLLDLRDAIAKREAGHREP